MHPLFGFYLGVHGSGVGAGGYADGNVKALPTGRKDISIIPSRVGEDVYSSVRCAGEGAHGGHEPQRKFAFESWIWSTLWY